MATPLKPEQRKKLLAYRRALGNLVNDVEQARSAGCDCSAIDEALLAVYERLEKLNSAYNPGSMTEGGK